MIFFFFFFFFKKVLSTRAHDLNEFEIFNFSLFCGVFPFFFLSNMR